MNLRQPYEQLIAGKLKNLPAPDADNSWQQMKRLLDEDENRGAGGKRPPGKGGGWWRAGIVAVLLSAGLWMYVEKAAPDASLSKNNPAANSSTANKTNTTDNNKNKTIDNTITLNGTTPNTPPEKNDDAANITAGKSVNEHPAATVSSALSEKNNTTNTNIPDKTEPGLPLAENNAGTEKKTLLPVEPNPTNKASKFKVDKDISKDQTAANKQNELAAANINSKNKSGNSNTIITGSSFGSRNTIAGTNINTNRKRNNNNKFIQPDNSSSDHLAEAGDVDKNQSSNLGTGSKRKTTAGNTPAENNSVASANNQRDNFTSNPFNNFIVAASVAKEKNLSGRLSELKVPAAPIDPANTALAIGDSMEKNRNVNNLLSNDTKKQIAKAQRDKAIEIQDKKDKKTIHLNLSNLFQPFSMHIDPEPWWAAGLSLNAIIPNGAQSRFGYNMNAKSSTLSDYIPSPFLEFHLNDNVFIHTEINLITPQYTPQLLVYRENTDITAQVATGVPTSQQKSIFVQKLYYFNWPFSLHYSPIRNFYFSAGLQFSSFQSGLASIQQIQYETAAGPAHPSSISNNVLKFKDDSIAAKLPANEWRWQAGAEYYWNRFTIGVRYNQSFKNLINTPATSTLPAMMVRNNAALFFIRYNLFESKKKEAERESEPTRY